MTTMTQHKIRDGLLGVVFTFIFALLFLWVGINWLAGCGETFPTAQGTYIEGECISLGQMFGID